MKYTAEVDSGAVIYTYIPNFIKTGSGIQMLLGGTHTDTQTER
jgi:hypothetical protein